MIFDLVQDFDAMLTAMPSKHSRRRIFKLLDEAIRRDIHFIERHPTAFFQCMWNTCWWYDLGESGEKRLDRSLEAEADRSTSVLLELWRREKGDTTPGFIWAQAMRPPAVSLGEQQNAVLSGHDQMIMALALSPDGRRIASGQSLVGILRIWDAISGSELACLKAHTLSIWHAAFTPDGRRLLTASADETVRIWDVDSWALVGQIGIANNANLARNNSVYSVVCSQDGRYIYSGHEDGMARCWDAATFRLLGSFKGHSGGVFTVAISPDGRTLVTGSGGQTKDYAIRVWDTARRRELHRLPHHRGDVAMVAFASDGHSFAAASRDGEVSVWDADGLRRLAACRGHTAGVECVAFFPDGCRIASAGNDGTIRIWDRQNGSESGCLRGHRGVVTGLAVTPDQRQLVSASADRTVRLWKTDTRAAARSLGHDLPLSDLCFSRDGAHLASASGDGIVWLWRAHDGKSVGCLEPVAGGIAGLAFSPDSKTLAGACPDGRILVWDVESKRQLRSLNPERGEINRLAYSPDGRTLAVGGLDVLLIDPESGIIRQTLSRTWEERAHTGVVTALGFSPDGRFLASGSRLRKAVVWDVATGAAVAVANDCGPPFESASEWNETRTVRPFYEIFTGNDSLDRALALAERSRRIWGVALSRQPSGDSSEATSGNLRPGGRLVIGTSGMQSAMTEIVVFGTDEAAERWPAVGDVAAIADPDRYPLQAFATGTETALVEAATGWVIGWLPAGSDMLATHPSGQVWALADGNELHLYRLEGVWAPGTFSGDDSARPSFFDSHLRPSEPADIAVNDAVAAALSAARDDHAVESLRMPGSPGPGCLTCLASVTMAVLAIWLTYR